MMRLTHTARIASVPILIALAVPTPGCNDASTNALSPSVEQWICPPSQADQAARLGGDRWRVCLLVDRARRGYGSLPVGDGGVLAFIRRSVACVHLNPPSDGAGKVAYLVRVVRADGGKVAVLANNADIWVRYTTLTHVHVRFRRSAAVLFLQESDTGSVCYGRGSRVGTH